MFDKKITNIDEYLNHWNKFFVDWKKNQRQLLIMMLFGVNIMEHLLKMKRIQDDLLYSAAVPFDKRDILKEDDSSGKLIYLKKEIKI
jgi:hypothetical protein